MVGGCLFCGVGSCAVHKRVVLTSHANCLTKRKGKRMYLLQIFYLYFHPLPPRRPLPFFPDEVPPRYLADACSTSVHLGGFHLFLEGDNPRRKSRSPRRRRPLTRNGPSNRRQDETKDLSGSFDNGTKDSSPSAVPSRRHQDEGTSGSDGGDARSSDARSGDARSGDDDSDVTGGTLPFLPSAKIVIDGLTKRGANLSTLFGRWGSNRSDDTTGDNGGSAGDSGGDDQHKNAAAPTVPGSEAGDWRKAGSEKQTNATPAAVLQQ